MRTCSIVVINGRKNYTIKVHEKRDWIQDEKIFYIKSWGEVFNIFKQTPNVR